MFIKTIQGEQKYLNTKTIPDNIITINTNSNRNRHFFFYHLAQKNKTSIKKNSPSNLPIKQEQKDTNHSLNKPSEIHTSLCLWSSYTQAPEWGCVSWNTSASKNLSCRDAFLLLYSAHFNSLTEKKILDPWCRTLSV